MGHAWLLLGAEVMKYEEVPSFRFKVLRGGIVGRFAIW
jgi:hypothetical protein